MPDFRGGKLYFNWIDCEKRADIIARMIETFAFNNGCQWSNSEEARAVKIYPVPRGGNYAALLVQKSILHQYSGNLSVLVNDPITADVIVDDIIDSAKTKDSFKHLEKPFYALVDKRGKDKGWDGIWINFPWEKDLEGEYAGPQENIKRILQFIGENPEREGLKETPHRVVKSYGELFGGYKLEVADVLKTFDDGACDEMVICQDIEFYSTCEHHMQPFFGKAHVAYIPNKKVIGVSKLARILDIYARRLQIQERLTTDVTTALMEHLQPKGAACIIEAKHFCMVCRGVKKQNSIMKTSSLTGVFREPAVRQELLHLLSLPK